MKNTMKMQNLRLQAKCKSTRALGSRLWALGIRILASGFRLQTSDFRLSSRILAYFPACLLLLIFSANIAKADLYWERLSQSYLSINNQKVDPTLSKEIGYIKANLVKVANQSTGEWRLFNLDNRMFWSVNPQARVYMEGTFDDLKKASILLDSKKAEGLQEMENALNSMPPQEREKNQKLIEAQRIQMSLRNAKITLNEGGAMQQIRQWKAKPITVMAGNQLLEKIWVTDDVKAPPAFNRFVDLLAEIDPFKFGHYKLIKAFPVLYESQFGALFSSTEVIKVEERNIPIVEFMLPLNFEKQPYTLPTQ